MFTPTHLLVSRSKQTPVQLIPAAKGFKLLTQPEWQQGLEAAFEIRPKQGFFCKEMPIVGYSLQPLNVDVAQSIDQNAPARLQNQSH